MPGDHSMPMLAILLVAAVCMVCITACIYELHWYWRWRDAMRRVPKNRWDD